MRSLRQLAEEESRHEAAIRDAAPDLDEDLIAEHWPAELGAPAARPLDPAQAGQRLALPMPGRGRPAMKTRPSASLLIGRQYRRPEAGRARRDAGKGRAGPCRRYFVAPVGPPIVRRRCPTHGWPKARSVDGLGDLRAGALPHERALSRRLEKAGLDPALDRIGDRIHSSLGRRRRRHARALADLNRKSRRGSLGRLRVLRPGGQQRARRVCHADRPEPERACSGTPQAARSSRPSSTRRRSRTGPVRC